MKIAHAITFQPFTYFSKKTVFINVPSGNHIPFSRNNVLSQSIITWSKAERRINRKTVISRINPGVLRFTSNHWQCFGAKWTEAPRAPTEPPRVKLEAPRGRALRDPGENPTNETLPTERGRDLALLSRGARQRPMVRDWEITGATASIDSTETKSLGW